MIYKGLKKVGRFSIIDTPVVGNGIPTYILQHFKVEVTVGQKEAGDDLQKIKDSLN